MDDRPRRVGQRLRLFRERCGLTQTELAERLHVSQPTLSAYERGTSQIDADDLPRFARALGVTPSAFFDERVGAPSPEQVLNWVQHYLRTVDDDGAADEVPESVQRRPMRLPVAMALVSQQAALMTQSRHFVRIRDFYRSKYAAYRALCELSLPWLVDIITACFKLDAYHGKGFHTLTQPSVSLATLPRL